MSVAQAATPLIRPSGASILSVSAAIGLTAALVLIASPLTACVALLIPLLFIWAGRGLPPEERRALSALLLVAIGARVATIVGLFIAGLPHLNDLSIGALSGDEAYNLSRALRTRDILLGFAQSKYDFFVVNDEYGRTLYLWLLGWVQVLFGPTPYSMRLVNTLLFVLSATLLYRMVRPAFGAAPSLFALAALLFTPSLFFSSVTLLKESLYFLASTIVLTRSFDIIRHPRPRAIIASVGLIVVALWILNDLRRSAAVLTLAGIGCGLAAWILAARRWRMVAATIVLIAAMGSIAAIPSLRDRALERVLFAAKTHAGHVFTVGHAYKLMDEGFYQSPGIGEGWDIKLTEAQALRFLVRAGVSFVVTPLPWEMASRSELAFLAEHLWWYLLVAALPFGIATGWQRDRLSTALLVGFVLPTAVALAITNGNVGTLLRLRGLVSPYIVWLSALGMLSVAEAILAKVSPLHAPPAPALAVRGPSS